MENQNLALLIIFTISLSLSVQLSFTIEILSKSKLEKCEKVSENNALNCSSKIILNLAIPSESGGRESSLVAEIVEVGENDTDMRTLREPPVITINKSAVYALYDLSYDRDVAYKPEEFFVKTRKCDRDAGADIVEVCERLRDEKGDIIEKTRPICCPCGDQRRVPSSCGNFFDKMVKGKANTAHCLRYTGDWFHVFGVGQRSIGFNIRIEVKTRLKTLEVIVGPDNRTATSNDNFMRVNIIGDYVGYKGIPAFEDCNLVIPREGGGHDKPQYLGGNISMWMMLQKMRFGDGCNKIGVGYEAFNTQPDFCSSPFRSCLHEQLWELWESDQNLLRMKREPEYCLQGKYERINQHPNAGSGTFSIGITEVLNTDLMIELRADDIEYVYQRSPGKILSIIVPNFEALTQFGIATITTKNIGELEASYSLTFDCSTGVNKMEEQFYIMKQNEVINRSFKLYPTTEQAGKYVCAAILKDSAFSELDRAECQFITSATIFDNGSQIPFQPPKSSINGFFESIEELLNQMWTSLVEFITGKSCRSKCSGFFDFSCHVQYICINWIVMFGLLLAIFPTVIVLLYLLHQKGVFDPLYDWWEDHFWTDEQRPQDIHRHEIDTNLLQDHLKKNPKHKHHAQKRRKGAHKDHKHNHKIGEENYEYHIHHVHKDKHTHKHGRTKSLGIIEPGDNDLIEHHHKRIKNKDTTKDKDPIFDDVHHKPHVKRRE